MGLSHLSVPVSPVVDVRARAVGARGQSTIGRPDRSFWSTFALTVCALGGPLALAGLIVPRLAQPVDASAGWVVGLGLVAFVPMLRIWLDFARHVPGRAGLTSYVEAVAGRRAALVQSLVWTVSYVLYLVSTTAGVVYGLLPTMFAGVRSHETALDVAIVLALVAVVRAGHRVAVAVAGALAAGQLVLLLGLAGITVGHLSPDTAFGVHAGGSADAGSLGRTAGELSLLFACSSLPLFLNRRPQGGERVSTASATRGVRRGVVAGFAITAAAVAVIDVPMTADAAGVRAAVPGMAVADVFGSPGFATVIGVGVAVSVIGVMLVEFLALIRVGTWQTGWSPRRVTTALGVVFVAVTVAALPARAELAEALERPSLIALWLSQMPVVALYPRFVAGRGGNVLIARAWAAAALALVLFGVWASAVYDLS